MTIAFTRLFTTQGYHVGALNEINAYRGFTLTNRENTLLTQLIANPTVYGSLLATPPANLSTAQSAENTYAALLSSEMLAAMQADVAADRPGVATSLQSTVTELVRQMIIGSQSLNHCPGTVTLASVGSPTGDETFVFGSYDPVLGTQVDFFVPDVIRIVCSEDQSNGATAYAEPFSFTGLPANSLSTDAAYPSGSGVSTSVSAIDPQVDQTIVQNGMFASTNWVSNTPGSWTIASGSAGVNVFQITGNNPRGTASANTSCSLVSDGTNLVKLRQTLTGLTPNTVYAVSFRTYKAAAASTYAEVSVRLVDAVAGTAVTGNNSYANIVTSTSTNTMTGDWTNVFTGTFMTPAVLPVNGIAIEILLSSATGISNVAVSGNTVYVWGVNMQQQTALYSGGPTGPTIFSGRLAAVMGDTRTATVAIQGTTGQVTAVSGSGTTVTVTTSAPHGYAVGQSITLAGVTTTTAYNGTYTIATIPSATTFTFTSTTTGTAVVTGATLSPGSVACFLIRGLDRLLGLAALAPLRIPTAATGSATIADTLVV